ncbi:MAG: hypothetical protein AB7S75_04670 [Desulfococcaceae bacterium]
MRTDYSNPMIDRAFDALEVLSADCFTRYFAERRETAMKDETASGHKKGNRCQTSWHGFADSWADSRFWI